MKKSLFKIICLISLCAILLSMFSACGNSKQGEEGTTTVQSTTEAIQTESTEADNRLEWESDTSPVTLSSFVNYSWITPLKNGWGGDLTTAEILKRTGVTITNTTATSDDNQQLNMLLSSNDLPDFIFTAVDQVPYANMWKEGLVYPVTELMKKYVPKMETLIPKDMNKFFTEDDGNWYFMPLGYNELDKVSQLKGFRRCAAIFAINSALWTDSGSPSMKTLDDYKAALQQIVKKHPEVKFPAYDGYINNPDDNRELVQSINRIYGGTGYRHLTDDGKVHLNIRDDTYLKALKYVNDLFRSGLFNPENFTIKSGGDQEKGLILDQKIFSYWLDAQWAYQYDKLNSPYDAFEPPQVPGVQLKLNDESTSIGYFGVVISKNCKNPDRAIKYLEFLMTEEGQKLMALGPEGKAYTMVDNYPKKTQECLDDYSKDWAKAQEKWGLSNWSWTWIMQGYYMSLYSYWDSQSYPKDLKAQEIYNKFANNERMQDILVIKTGSPEAVSETKIKELWKASMPKMLLAKSEAECEAAYNDFIKKVDTLGAADVEKAYTAQYLKYKQLLGK